MTFEAPVWLYLTPWLLLLFGAMLVYGFRRRDALLSRFAASRLLDELTEQASRPRTWIKAACVLLAVAGIGLALARPQYGVEWSERKARGLDIVFVLDSSKSMLATDLRPTRLDRAKLAIIDLVERLESDRIGLVAFAGQAFLQTPPTLDYAAFRESLDAVDPGIMTSGGSDLGTALKEAAEAFPSDNNLKVAVLLTDGEDLGGHAIAAAEEARASGIQVFAIGIGTPEGEYLKVRNEQGIQEFVRDAEGKPVRSQLDEPTLQQIAQITGGSYRRLSSESLDQLYRNVIATLPREERESELQEIHIERFQWALSAAAIFLVLETLIRRRRSAAIQAGVLVMLSLGFSPHHAEAQDDLPIQETGNPQAPEGHSTDTPQRADARSLYNAAYESLSAGEYEAAAQLYESALSQTQDLQLQRDTLYNMGHAAYQQGRASYDAGDPQTALEQMKKAEDFFKSAQEIDPSDASIQEDLEQVTRIREMIEQLQEQQQEQQQSQDSENSEESEDSEQKQDPSQDSQQQQGDSQQNQDESQQGEEQESQDSQSGEDSQQEQNSQQDQSGEENSQSSQNAQGENAESPSDPQDQDSQQEGDPENGESAQGAPQESTQDPVDDIPQPQPGEESENGDEEAQSAGQPEPTAGQPGEEGSATTGQLSGEPIEGMTEAEAAALLDSLRGKETLLPFIDQPRSGRPHEIRDW